MSSFINQAVKSHKAVIFGWVSCPFCTRAESILSGMTNDFKVYHIESMSEGNAIKQALESQYNHDTVPAIFINGKFIGGCSDLESLQYSGQLQQMLNR